jgi:hypothetical protein
MRVPAHDRADILDDRSPLQLSAVPFIALCAAAPPTVPAVVVTGSRCYRRLRPVRTRPARAGERGHGGPAPCCTGFTPDEPDQSRSDARPADSSWDIRPRVRAVRRN